MAVEREGGLVGNGGSIVQTPSGATLPADFFYSRVAPGKPDSYQKVTLDDFPGLSEEIERLEKILRARDRSFEPLSLSSYELYLTAKLSSEEPLPVLPEMQSRAVTFTYSFAELEKGKGYLKKRRVIEIQPDLFGKLSPRNQALLLVHEVLHHRTAIGHDLISPLIHGLAIASDLYERQSAGDRSDLTDEEYERILGLQGTLYAIRTDSGSGMTISRRGGGLLTCFLGFGPIDCNAFAAKNFVGVTSTVQFMPEKDQVRLPEENVILDSYVTVSATPQRCAGNLVQGVRPAYWPASAWLNGLVVFECAGSDNVLTDIQNDEQQVIRIEGDRNRIRSLMLYSFASLAIQGHGNVFLNAELRQKMNIVGDRNVLEASVLKRLELSDAKFTRLNGALSIRSGEPGARAEISDSWMWGEVDARSSFKLSGLKLDVSQMPGAFFVDAGGQELRFSQAYFYELKELRFWDRVREKMSDDFFGIHSVSEFEERFAAYRQASSL